MLSPVLTGTRKTHTHMTIEQIHSTSIHELLQTKDSEDHTSAGGSSPTHHLQHDRGPGPVQEWELTKCPAHVVDMFAAAGLKWSSFNGKSADLVAPTPLPGGLNGGVARKPLPASIPLPGSNVWAVVDPGLTRHLSTTLNNEVADALQATVLSDEWSDAGAGRHDYTAVLYQSNPGTSEPAFIRLRFDFASPLPSVCAIGITYSDGRSLSAPVHPDKLTLGQLEITIPQALLDERSWLHNLPWLHGLPTVDAPTIEEQADPQQPSMRHIKFNIRQFEVELRLCQEPDGSYQLDDAQTRTTTALQTFPQPPFSYSRYSFANRLRHHSERLAQFGDLPAPKPMDNLERCIEFIQQGTCSFLPDPTDSKQWYTTMDWNGTPLTLKLTFEDDNLKHLVDVQRLLPGRDPVIPTRTDGGIGSVFDRWNGQVHGTSRAATFKKSFANSDLLNAWSANHAGKNQHEIVNDALEACAKLEPRYTGRRENLVRGDGHPVAIQCMDPAHHIYRYDTVMEGKDVSLAMQFTLDNRRVFKDIALLSGRDAQLDEVGL
jgi:hypothetical protein